MKSWIMMTFGVGAGAAAAGGCGSPPPVRPTSCRTLHAAIEQVEPSVVKAWYALEAAGHAGRRIAASPYEWFRSRRPETPLRHRWQLQRMDRQDRAADLELAAKPNSTKAYDDATERIACRVGAA